MMRSATLVGGCALVGLFASVVVAQDCETGGIWVTVEELSVLPMQGPAWDNVLAAADEPVGTPNLGDITDGVDVRIMANALVYARTGVDTYRQAVVLACINAIGTEQGSSTLGLSRNLLAYVIAADLVGLPPAADEIFRAWLLAVRDADLLGRTLRTTHEDRPNNWGTHAGASRAAVALYLCDAEDFEQATRVFKGWLGDRDAYAGFDYGELWWQADPMSPVGINPVGSTIQGYSVDGVLPDDQRRGGPFAWPPPQENYVYTALQGSLAHAVILDRQGYDVWNWSDRALLRAFRWLHEQAGYPAVGDDTWQPHVINHYYHTDYPATAPSIAGKNVGWTDWTHGTCFADFNGDGWVNDLDLLILFLEWGSEPDGLGRVSDLNQDGIVGITDFLGFLSAWGRCGA